MIKRVKTENRDAWRELRGQYIGGSDAAAVVGMNRFKSAYALWAEKTGKVPPFEGNLATDVGTFLEEFVAERFCRETGKRVRRENQSIFNDMYPWAIANVDRVVIGEDAGLECKTTSEMNLKRFANGEFPENYYVQCMHYMAVTGKPVWYLACLIGNRDFRIYTIERNDDEITALMNAEYDFYYNHWLKDVPPAADGSASTEDTLTALYPESDDSEVSLDGYRAELRQYVDLGVQIKELESIRDQYANRIKAFMGEAGKGTADGFRVSFASSVRNTFDSKRFAAENTRIDLSPYYRQSQTRIFKVTETGK